MSIEKIIRENIKNNVALTALGNSDRKMKDVATDIINAAGMSYGDVAEQCFLCEATVKNLATGKTKNPQSETIERVFRAFAYQLDMKAVRLNTKYRNKPKE